MHLVAAARDRMDQTIHALRELDVQRLGPTHCTGSAATVELWSALPERCFPCAVGVTMQYEVA
jgi:7,8-dihydropterin-6-yl-methyl-4-(beta-D-ribofuranosyl)aminobenzene 5'-phosphate synthase